MPKTTNTTKSQLRSRMAGIAAGSSILALLAGAVAPSAAALPFLNNSNNNPAFNFNVVGNFGAPATVLVGDDIDLTVPQFLRDASDNTKQLAEALRQLAPIIAGMNDAVVNYTEVWNAVDPIIEALYRVTDNYLTGDDIRYLIWALEQAAPVIDQIGDLLPADVLPPQVTSLISTLLTLSSHLEPLADLVDWIMENGIRANINDVAEFIPGLPQLPPFLAETVRIYVDGWDEPRPNGIPLPDLIELLTADEINATWRFGGHAGDLIGNPEHAEWAERVADLQRQLADSEQALDNAEAGLRLEAARIRDEALGLARPIFEGAIRTLRSTTGITATVSADTWFDRAPIRADWPTATGIGAGLANAAHQASFNSTLGAWNPINNTYRNAHAAAEDAYQLAINGIATNPISIAARQTIATIQAQLDNLLSDEPGDTILGNVIPEASGSFNIAPALDSILGTNRQALGEQLAPVLQVMATLNSVIAPVREWWQKLPNPDVFDHFREDLAELARTATALDNALQRGSDDEVAAALAEFSAVLTDILRDRTVSNLLASVTNAGVRPVLIRGLEVALNKLFDHLQYTLTTIPTSTFQVTETLTSSLQCADGPILNLDGRTLVTEADMTYALTEVGLAGWQAGDIGCLVSLTKTATAPNYRPATLTASTNVVPLRTPDFGAPTVEQFDVTINGGQVASWGSDELGFVAGSRATFAAGTTIHIQASVPTGHQFHSWTSDVDGVEFIVDAQDATRASFIMPSEAVTVTAHTFSPTPDLPNIETPTVERHELTVEGGEVVGFQFGDFDLVEFGAEDTVRSHFTAGTVVHIRAEQREGYRFHGWRGAQVANHAAVETTFVMPADDVTIEADFAAIFVPVNNIWDVPTTLEAGDTISLGGTVLPSNATNRDIVWEIHNGRNTGATLEGNALTATSPGLVTVRGTIADGLGAGRDWTRLFQVNVTANRFVPVTGITGVPASIVAGQDVTLAGAVAPATATSQDIVWRVTNARTTGATVSGNVLSATSTGTITLEATVANGQTNGRVFRQIFTVQVTPATAAFVPVTGITGVPVGITAGESIALNALVTVAPQAATNQDITWSVFNDRGTNASISGDVLTASNPGFVTIEAAIANGQTNGRVYRQTWHVLVTPAARFVPVTGILAGLPESIVAGEALTLGGQVVPGDATATNQDIVWSIHNARATDASIDGNVLTANNAGRVTVEAAIANGGVNGRVFRQTWHVLVTPAVAD